MRKREQQSKFIFHSLNHNNSLHEKVFLAVGLEFITENTPRPTQLHVSTPVLPGPLSVQSEREWGWGLCPPAMRTPPPPERFPFLPFLLLFPAITSDFLRLPAEFTSILLLPPFLSFTLLSFHSLSSRAHLFSAFSPLSQYILPRRLPSARKIFLIHPSGYISSTSHPFSKQTILGNTFQQQHQLFLLKNRRPKKNNIQ